MSDFALHVDGKKYEGWRALRVSSRLEELSPSFVLNLTNKWSDEDDADVAIIDGDTCAISYNGSKLYPGYVDTVTSEYDAESRSLTVNGRAKTCDLIDCSAIHKGGQWNKRSLLDIARDLCGPFDISVNTNTDVGGQFTVFKIEDGETVFQLLERAARRRGVLMLTDRDGNLLFDRVGTTRVKTSLVYGENIKKGSYTRSMDGRFSSYTVKAQAQGNDNFFGEKASALKRSVDDTAVARYRPLIINAEDEDSGSELLKRAKWERNVRAGRAKRLSYDVQGWEHKDGLWQLNQLVHVKDSKHKVDDDLLIVGVAFVRSEEEGSVTTLELTLPEAFSVQPLPPPKKKSKELF